MAATSQPLVSIITPTYKHASYIAACIESLQSQTYQNWEQIIIDDGSPDNTTQVVARYLDDTRIKYVRQDNRGIWQLAENYNLALQMSRGSCIAILEGDDLWPSDRLATQVPVFDDPQIGMSYGRIHTIDNTGQLCVVDTQHRNTWIPPYAALADSNPLAFLKALLLLRGNVGAVSVIFRRSALESVGSFWQPNYFPAVDFTTLLRVATHYRTNFVDHPLGYWRQHAGQTTDIRGLEYAIGHTRAAIEYYRSLPTPVRQELGISAHDIVHSRRHYLASAYWGAIRANMRLSDWTKARRNALQMMRWGNTFQKLEGMTSLLASILHVNIDSLVERVAHVVPVRAVKV